MINLQPGERVLLVVRRFPLQVIGQGALLAVIAFLPLFVFAGVSAAGGAIAAAIAPYEEYATTLGAAWLLILWLGFAVTWTGHYLDVLVITTDRIIDIEQIGLFSRDQAEMWHENLEDIHVESAGFILNLLDVGSISLQSAGQSREFVMEDIRHPERVKDVIARARAMKSRPLQAAGAETLADEKIRAMPQGKNFSEATED